MVAQAQDFAQNCCATLPHLLQAISRPRVGPQENGAAIQKGLTWDLLRLPFHLSHALPAFALPAFALALLCANEVFHFDAKAPAKLLAVIALPVGRLPVAYQLGIRFGIVNGEWPASLSLCWPLRASLAAHIQYQLSHVADDLLQSRPPIP